MNNKYHLRERKIIPKTNQIHFIRNKPKKNYYDNAELTYSNNLINDSKTKYYTKWFDPTKRKHFRKFGEEISCFTGTKIDVKSQIKILKEIIEKEIIKH